MMSAFMKAGTWARDRFGAASRIFPASQRATAEWLLEHAPAGEDGSAASRESAPFQERPVQAVADNDVLAHGAHRLGRPARRRQAKLGRLRKREQEVDTSDASRWLRHIEPFVTAFLVFAASILAGGIVLEASGTIPSLRIWSATLGGSWVTYVMAVALGVVLTILGGFAGYLVELSREATRVLRIALLAGAATIAVISALTIFETSSDRDVNLRSSAAITQASLLTTTAAELERKAGSDEARAAALRGKDVPAVPSADAKRAEATSLRAQAKAITAKAYKDRRLHFFAFAQLAALALAVVGGWAYAACAQLRLRRRVETLKASVKRIEQRAWSALLEIVALGARSTAVAAQAANPRLRYDNSQVEERAVQLFELIMNPPESPSPAASPRISPRPAARHNGSGDPRDLAGVTR